MKVHASRTLRPCDIVVREFIPVTTVARTVLDLGDVLRPEQLANVLYEAEFRYRLVRRSLEAQLRRHRGRRAAGVLRRAIALRDAGSAGLRSVPELRYFELARTLVARDPRINTHVDLPGGGIEVDFHWPQLRLCVEVDGPGHRRLHTRTEDEARDQRLRDAGWTVVRCTPAEIEADGSALVARHLALSPTWHR